MAAVQVAKLDPGLVVIGHMTRGLHSFLGKYRHNRVPIKYEGGAGIGKVKTEI